MHFETKGRNKHAILWAIAGHDGNGDAKVSTPTQLHPIRWDEGRRESITPQGSPIAYDAMLYSAAIITAGSIVWKGKLTALPLPVLTNLFEVTGTEETDGIDNRSTNKAYTLQRWKGRLPTVVS